MTVYYGSGISGTYITSFYANSTGPYDVTFPASYQGAITLRVDSWVLTEGNPYGAEQSFLTVNVRVPSPARPNGGLITACQVGDHISVTSLPALTSGPDDCDFHCDLEWAGPSNWTFEDNTPPRNASGNPLVGTPNNTKLVVPAGVTNGNNGQVTVTAYYSLCGFTLNTSSSARIWYGTPTIANTYVNGAPSQSFSDVPNGQAYLSIASTDNAATSVTWEIVSGSGYLYPSGDGCNVSIPNFAQIVVHVANNCGVGSSYTYYIHNSSQENYGYRVAPNPSSSKLSILFDYPEMTDAVTSITLLNEKGKEVKSFDGKRAKNEKYFEENKSVNWDIRDLPKGNYFLHVTYDSVVSKSQVLIN